MLDDYKEEQKIVYQILKNAIKKDRLSHAYLFETKGNKNAYNMIIAFVKYILCPYNKTLKTDCGKCTQCEKIDKNIFSELKIIEPDGLWIKKEQLEELQQEFSYKAVEANKKIYIIKNADRLNESSANSILKFIEEPEANVIALLIADNLYQVKDTIISRCQIINFNKNQNNELDYIQKLQDTIKIPFDITEDTDLLKEKIQNVITFINTIENKKLDSIIYTNKLFHSIFKEKNEIIFAFDIIILYYKDIINEKINQKKEFFNNYDTDDIKNNNTLETLNNKLLISIDTKDKINYNANTNLLIDKYIIDIVRGDKVEEDSWSNI